MQLEAAVREVIAADKTAIPVLPAQAQESLAAANDPTVGHDAVRRLIEPDPAISARVLSAANSPIYGAREVGSIRYALMLLGADTLKQLLQQALIDAHAFQQKGVSRLALQREKAHAFGVAQLSHVIARQCAVARPEAFLCGLLHDCGRIVCHGVLSPMGASEEDAAVVINRLHTEVGAQVARRWGLPPAVAQCAAEHHNFLDGRPDADEPELPHIVAAADVLASASGYGDTDVSSADEPERSRWREHKVWEGLALGPYHFEQLEQKAQLIG